MTKTEVQSESSRSLSQCLADGLAWSLADRLQVLRGVAELVRGLHRNGQTHRAISADTVHVDERLQPQLGPPAPHGHFGGQGADPEFCPPELIAGSGVALPAEIEAVAAALRQGGYALDPRRIDVYQLGTLLCRMLTGESVLGYMYDPKVKAKIPGDARSLLQRTLGDGDAESFADCDSLIDALDEALRQIESRPPATGHRDTPAGGSVIGAESDTPRHGHRPREPKLTGSDLPFERLGPYPITGRIGSGGMGDVYRGRDESLDRDVAIKVLPPELARDEDFVRRFKAEAAAVAKLTHPNVVPVYYIGEDQGYHFFAMRFVEGEPLSARLARSGRLPVEEAAALIEQCLAGLRTAHAENLIHRDIKPGNILLERETGRPVLVDFGLVRQLGQQTRMTATGMVMGTVDYMAPEQARGHKTDCRADIYALGVLLYQTLAGRLPFDAETPTAMIFQHAYEDPLPLTRWVPDLPEPIVQITARMMAKNRDERYATCDDVLADIEAFKKGRPLAPPPQPKEGQESTDESASSRSGQSLDPKSGDLDDDVVAATTELPVADDVALPADLDNLADDSPLRRVRDFAATMFRRHAPEFVQNLQSTTQQVDGAVAHYERRRGRMVKLRDEARSVAAELAEQLEAGEQIVSSATEKAESAGSDDQREAALETGRKAEEDVEALRRHLDTQQGQIDEMEHEVAKVEATLVKLRSQRDVLQARLKAAQARGQIEGGQRPAGSRRWLVPLAAVACLLVLTPLCLLLILPRSERPPVEPETVPATVDRTTLAPPVTDVQPSVPAEPVDLLSLADLDRDVLQGQWYFDGPTLVAESIVSPRHNQDRVLQFPVLLPEQYDLEFEVQPVAGHPSFGLGLQLGGKRCLAVLCGRWGNEHFICGSPVQKGATLPADRPSTVRCEVRRSGPEYAVRVLFDGAEVFTWQGETKRLNAGESFHFALPADNRVPFLRFREGTYHIHRMALTPVSGPARLLEFAGPADTPDHVAALRTLWKRGRVWISIDGQPPVKIDRPANLPPKLVLTRIDLRNNFALTDADVATFRGLSDLEELDIEDTPVTDEGVGKLADLPKLHHLDLSSTQITDASLAALGQLPGLRTLSLYNTQVSGEGLEHLASLTGLGQLDLRYSRVNDQGLEHRKVPPGLKQLWLDHTFVTDAGMAALSNLGQLNRLSLTGTNVSDSAVPALQQLDGLESLALFGTRFTEGGLTALRKNLAASVAGDADETVDLMQLVDTQGGAVQGNWRFDQGDLLSCATGCARVQIPYIPPEEYILEAVVQRESPNGFALGLIGGGRQFSLNFDRNPPRYSSGIDRLDGQSPWQNESEVTGQVFPDGEPVTLAVTVRNTGLSVTRNGESLLQWEGDYARCSLHVSWRIPRRDVLFVGSLQSYRVKALRLTPLSGKGKVIRLRPADTVDKNPVGPERTEQETELPQADEDAEARS